MDFDFKGNVYRFSKMEAKQQFHVMRRLLPVLGAVGSAWSGLIQATDAETKKEALLEMAEAVGPLAEALSTLSDANVDYVMDVCSLMITRRGPEMPPVFHPVYVPSRTGPLLMFQDIDAPMQLRLVSEVIKENLKPFFELLSGDSASSLSVPQ